MEPPSSDELYRAIFESAPDAVVVVDTDGEIQAVNEAAETLFGYARAELVGRPVEVLVPEPYREHHTAYRREYTDEPHPRPMGLGLDLLARHKDGTQIPVEISLNHLPRAAENLVIATIRDVTQRKRLREFGAASLRASEEERQRIARELHDDTAQRLATLLVRLRILERSGDDSDWRTMVGNVRDELKECAEGVRRIARGLRPPELEDAGVVAALRSHVRTVSESAGVRIDFESDPVDPVLSADTKLVLYRVVQEAISNAVRHSGADEVSIRVRRNRSRVEAVVEDDGTGFDPDRVKAGDSSGLGLIGMQERAAMAGGGLEVRSRPGEGTRVRVRLPMELDAEVQRV